MRVSHADVWLVHRTHSGGPNQDVADHREEAVGDVYRGSCFFLDFRWVGERTTICLSGEGTRWGFVSIAHWCNPVAYARRGMLSNGSLELAEGNFIVHYMYNLYKSRAFSRYSLSMDASETRWSWEWTLFYCLGMDAGVTAFLGDGCD